MNDKRYRSVLSWAGWAIISVLLLQADRNRESRNLLADIAEFLLKVAAAAVGYAVAAIGGWTDITRALVMVMAIDYATGLIVAANGKSKKTQSGKLSSAAGFKGLLKKGTILGVIALAHLVDQGVGNGSSTVRDFACWCYIANDALSILENVSALGNWVPPPLKRMLETTRDTGKAPSIPTENTEVKKGSNAG